MLHMDSFFFFLSFPCCNTCLAYLQQLAQREVNLEDDDLWLYMEKITDTNLMVILGTLSQGMPQWISLDFWVGDIHDFPHSYFPDLETVWLHLIMVTMLIENKTTLGYIIGVWRFIELNLLIVYIGICPDSDQTLWEGDAALWIISRVACVLH